MSIARGERRKEVVNGKNLRLPEFETAFLHPVREQGRERIIGRSRFPHRNGEKSGVLADAGVKDQPGRRRNGRTANPALPILVGRHARHLLALSALILQLFASRRRYVRRHRGMLPVPAAVSSIRRGRSADARSATCLAYGSNSSGPICRWYSKGVECLKMSVSVIVLL